MKQVAPKAFNSVGGQAALVNYGRYLQQELIKLDCKRAMILPRGKDTARFIQLDKAFLKKHLKHKDKSVL